MSNNLPLQPLVWDSQNYTQSAFHQYLVRKDDEAKKNSKSQYVVAYGRINTQQSSDVATGFATIEEAKAWAWKHYNEKMQPYIKPLPTWIDVNDRLPQEDGLYLTLRKGFTFEMGNESDLVPKVSGWNGGRGCFDDDYGNVLFTHWMPLPELPVSKESDCEG